MEFLLDYILGCELRTFTYQVLLLLHRFDDLLLFIFHFILYGALSSSQILLHLPQNVLLLWVPCPELIPFTSHVTELVKDSSSPCKPCLAGQTFLHFKGGLGVVLCHFNNMTVLTVLGIFSMSN